MPEPILLTLASIGVAGYAALGGYGRKDTAVSEEIRNVQLETVKYYEQSQSLFGAKALAISSLLEIASESSEDNWDGYEANPVSPIAMWRAEEFIRALPAGFPMPEAAVEPDGSISLDWIAPNRRVVLSIGESNRLAFAWLVGSDSGHAVEKFDGMNIPDRFIAIVGPIVDYGKLALRTA
jgi:hypothetical protein